MDLFHRLPYEAQLLVMRCVAHPAALHLQRSARFEHLAAIARLLPRSASTLTVLDIRCCCVSDGVGREGLNSGRFA